MLQLLPEPKTFDVIYDSKLRTMWRCFRQQFVLRLISHCHATAAALRQGKAIPRSTWTKKTQALRDRLRALQQWQASDPTPPLEARALGMRALDQRLLALYKEALDWMHRYAGKDAANIMLV
jgi:hypothetical protein